MGGMESYVWNLSRSLSLLGVDIKVVCESIHSEPDFSVDISYVRPSREPRRWKAMREFIGTAETILKKLSRDRSLILHSHERCRLHHVTTIHGPPMPRYSDLAWYKKISPRVRAWTSWERNEVCSTNVQAVVPVSNYVRRLILERYPCCAEVMSEPGYPGLSEREPDFFVRSQEPLKLLFFPCKN